MKKKVCCFFSILLVFGIAAFSTSYKQDVPNQNQYSEQQLLIRITRSRLNRLPQGERAATR